MTYLTSFQIRVDSGNELLIHYSIPYESRGSSNSFHQVKVGACIILFTAVQSWHPRKDMVGTFICKVHHSLGSLPFLPFLLFICNSNPTHFRDTDEELYATATPTTNAGYETQFFKQLNALKT